MRHTKINQISNHEEDVIFHSGTRYPCVLARRSINKSVNKSILGSETDSEVLFRSLPSFSRALDGTAYDLCSNT